MGRPALGSVIGSLPESDIAAIIERIWEARGYDARTQFSGPDVHVRVSGETPEGTSRNVRVWVVTDGTVSAWRTRGFVRQCDRADEEPYLVVVGDGRVAGDAHRPEMVELDAASVAVRVREAGVESFAYDRYDDSDDEGDETERNWLGEPVDGDDDGDGDGSDDGDDGSGVDDREVGRRAAIKQGGKYVVGSFLAYLGVEWLADRVRESPAARAAVRRRARWVDARLPDVRLPEPGGDGPTPPPNGSEPAELPGGSVPETTPPAATTVAFSRLRTDPEAFVGTTVRYAGEVVATTERETDRLVVVRVAADGTVRGDLVGRWPAGRFFGDGVGFRLLEGTRVTVWGDVVGTSSAFLGETLPAVEVAALRPAE